MDPLLVALFVFASGRLVGADDSDILYGENFDDGEIAAPFYERYPKMEVGDKAGEDS